MMKCFSTGTLLAGFLAAGLWAWVGCESSDSEGNEEFHIDPADAVATESSPTVVLTAVGGYEPYTWSVSDSSLGTLTGGGESVTYARTGGNGANTVSVIDGHGWTASATISQQDGPPVVISPSVPTVSTNANSLAFTADGGSGSYSWTTTVGGVAPTTGSGTVLTLPAGTEQVFVTVSDGTSTAIATVNRE